MGHDAQCAPLVAYDWRGEFGEAFAKKRVLVTGSRGFFGTPLCEAMTTLGAVVHGISLAVDRPFGSPEACAQTHEIDITEAASVQKVVRQVSPELVFHLAAIVDTRPDPELVHPTLTVNLLGAVNVLSACRAIDCDRIVMVGSAEDIVGEGLAPPSPYAAAKLALQPYLRLFRETYALPVISVRPFLAFGPGQPPSRVVPHTIMSLQRGRSPRIRSAERTCDLIFVGDVVRGMLFAAAGQVPTDRTYDLGTGVGTTLRAVVQHIAEMMDGEARPEFAEPVTGTASAPPQVAFEHGDRLPDWEPVWSLDEGLRTTVAWYSACGWDLDGEGS